MPDVTQEQLEELQRRLVDLMNGGNYRQAIPLAEQARALALRLHGRLHPAYADVVNLLAIAHNLLGERDAAEPLYREALEVGRRVLPADSDELHLTLATLASLRRDKRDYAEAEAFAREALANRRKALGEKHPDLAFPLHELALVYLVSENFAAAEPVLREELEVQRAALGASHPDCGKTEELLTIARRRHLQQLNERVQRARSQGDATGAVEAATQFCDCARDYLGEASPDLAVGMANLGGMYVEAGNPLAAEPLLRQAVELCRRALGPAHPTTANCLNSLAYLHFTQQDYAEAERLYNQAAAAYRSAGDTGPGYAMLLHNLGALYYGQKKYPEAARCYREAVELRRRIGPDSPQLADSLNNLADVLCATGEHAAAEPLYRQALAIWESRLGETHPYTATGLRNLARLYRVRRDYPAAEAMYRRAIRAVTAAAGANHPAVADLEAELARLQEERGQQRPSWWQQVKAAFSGPRKG